MVTDTFIRNFYSETFQITPTDNAIITIRPEALNGAAAQIVKAEFVSCIPGLRFVYSNNLDVIAIGANGTINIEEPTDAIQIYTQSLIYPNDEIYGMVNYYYWYPEAATEDEIIADYIITY